MRLIDADYVLDHLKPYEQSDEEWSVTGGTALRLIHNAVGNAPTVDAVVMTRCKDCKYSCEDEHGRTCEGYWYELSEYAVPVKDDGFCSYGKPREKL